MIPGAQNYFADSLTREGFPDVQEKQIAADNDADNFVRNLQGSDNLFFEIVGADIENKTSESADHRIEIPYEEKLKLASKLILTKKAQDMTSISRSPVRKSKKRTDSLSTPKTEYYSMNQESPWF